MQLDTLEAVVRRLFTDTEFRSRAIANPSEALSEYRLSQNERLAVGKLCAQMPAGFGGRIGPLGTWF